MPILRTRSSFSVRLNTTDTFSGLESKTRSRAGSLQSGLCPLHHHHGSYGPDPDYSEAHVGTKYLTQRGIDANVIITEQGSGTNPRQYSRNGWPDAIQRLDQGTRVSDGFHMYRVKRMLEDAGVVAYTSPAPDSPDRSRSSQRYWHSLREVLLYTAYRLFNL